MPDSVYLDTHSFGKGRHTTRRLASSQPAGISVVAVCGCAWIVRTQLCLSCYKYFLDLYPDFGHPRPLATLFMKAAKFSPLMRFLMVLTHSPPTNIHCKEILPNPLLIPSRVNVPPGFFA